MNINPNAPAFPSHGSMGEVCHEGMTIRAEIAARILAGITANSLVGEHHIPQVAVRQAVELADLLIAELNKAGGAL